MRAKSLVVALFWLGPLVFPTLAAEKLLGLPMEQAKKTDFFTFFHLEQTGSETDQAKNQVLTFKTTGDFRRLVTVRVTLDPGQRIGGMELTFLRSFVDHPFNSVFARDFAKSMLRAMLPEADAKKVADLVNEIEFGLTGQAHVLAGKTPPRLPAVPTPGYEAFLGKRASHVQDLESVRLELRNQKGDQEEPTLVMTVCSKK
jgi:hypothetical protein